MTTLDLDGAALAPVSDLSDVVILASSTESVSDSESTAIRTYAGGRRRVVSTPASGRTVSVGYELLERSEYDSLLALVGIPILFRDPRQRRVFGVIASISATELPAVDLIENVSFTIEEYSHSEIV